MSETTPTPIAEMGFSDAELELLREAGVIGEERLARPWEPETLEDVDWLCWRMAELGREAAAIETRAALQVEQLQKARDIILARYSDAMQLVVAHALPRDPKTGKVRRKSLDLDRVKVGFRSRPGGPRITDEVALLGHLKDLAAHGSLPAHLADAIQVTERFTGTAAVERIFTDGERSIKILAAPIKAAVHALPPVVDRETGEATPATLPGVEIEPAVEHFYFDSGWRDE